MLDALIAPWREPFMIRALVAGLLASLLGGYYGAFVVQRRLSFLGDGLSHAAFGGAALGILLGVEPLWIALPAALLAAAGMIWVQGRTPLGGDAAIGVFYSAAMALGIVFLFLRKDYARDAFAYLFGSILFVSWPDVAVVAAMAALTAAAWPLWSRWAYSTFDRELALADRLPVRREDAALYMAVAAVVVASIKLVGMTLVAAFLVIPPATARLWARTFASMTLLGMAIGAASVALGLWASYHVDLPSGSCIILLQAAAFFASAAIRRR